MRKAKKNSFTISTRLFFASLNGRILSKVIMCMTSIKAIMKVRMNGDQKVNNIKLVMNMNLRPRNRVEYKRDHFVTCKPVKNSSHLTDCFLPFCNRIIPLIDWITDSIKKPTHNRTIAKAISPDILVAVVVLLKLKSSDNDDINKYWYASRINLMYTAHVKNNHICLRIVLRIL